MQSTHQPDQPAQPPKEAGYNQASNPVTQTPYEQRTPQQSKARQRGDPTSSITRRTADSRPANDERLRQLNADREQEREALHRAASGVDLEYGVEQQPAEGEIAHAVESTSGRARARAQAGAHAGAVGSASGPGGPGYEKGLAADMDRKAEEHERVLGERVGQSPAEPDDDGALAEREAVRERKLKQDRELDVKGAVARGTGDPVVG
ncbi:uncharacterized protein BO95DRAFT_270012 [Aspergillus brunneoviolaceus CBS 621.78]|uniref:Uncharacterized protein n=1 Tax=Aspergillus brunneoviolaceus CBS 621.78 TaxID=1450534 RepID=A0ACD1GKB5_9EURO|nr:hypothetical protein BO95DRAFT_270012 [Aspergillus brunneoviolaceus CBS 621.78]RAH49667.1 hypothetical protein BO95DRAFT_270012 [Aspergillus brunneoviolaceus CBS 621.78]